MKRKRRQIVGDDGELLPPYSTKLKRGERSRRGNMLAFLVLLALIAGGILAIPVYLTVAPERTVTTSNAVVAENLITSEPKERATLPPTWTAMPSSTASHTPTLTSTVTATATATATPLVRERVVTIVAQAGWQSGETVVETGEVIEISYVNGHWFSWPGTGPFGPDGGFFGICDQDDCVEPLRGYSQSGLIARIGENGEFWPVGYRASRVAEVSGELQLRINDDYTTDNEGSVTMRIVVKHFND